MATSAERAAENESIFREANEQIEEQVEELTLEEGRSPFLCECEDTRCRDMLRLSVSEYESVRAHPDRFVIVPGHPYAHARVIEETDRFTVIEKIGEAGRVAEQLDPRSGG